MSHMSDGLTVNGEHLGETCRVCWVVAKRTALLDWRLAPCGSVPGRAGQAHAQARPGMGPEVAADGATVDRAARTALVDRAQHRRSHRRRVTCAGGVDVGFAVTTNGRVGVNLANGVGRPLHEAVAGWPSRSAS